MRNRLDEIPHELANPSRRAAKELSKELFPAAARMSRPRQGTEETVARIDAAAVRAFYDAHVRPATATAVVVGDLDGVDLDAAAGRHPRRLDGIHRRAARRVRRSPPTTPAAWSSWTAPAPSRRSCSSGASAPDRHDRVWPAQVLGTYCLGGTLTSRLDRVLREEKGYTYGVRAFGQVLRSTAGRHGRRAARHHRLRRHGRHRSRAGRPVEVLRTLAAEAA